jgi:hypothetical protein
VTPFPTVHSSGLLYGSLPDNNAQEQLSVNYVRSVATAARCHAKTEEIDFEGIDVHIKSMQQNHEIAFPSIEAQLKCTQRSDLVRDGYISWTLERDNYEQLRAKVAVPRILVVMLCPADFTAWLEQDDQRLSISHAAYWVSLHGAPELKPDQKSKTVRVPLSQPFTVETLLGMMAKTGKGEAL